MFLVSRVFFFFSSHGKNVALGKNAALDESTTFDDSARSLIMHVSPLLSLEYSARS